ncbi:MAG TPA: hypothetical protein VIY90_17750 [Steroidobacteraceae bacterium]
MLEPHGHFVTAELPERLCTGSLCVEAGVESAVHGLLEVGVGPPQLERSSAVSGSNQDWHLRFLKVKVERRPVGGAFKQNRLLAANPVVLSPG